MSEKELLPCPFCGGEAKSERLGSSAGYVFYVACQGTDCDLRPTTDGGYLNDDPHAEQSAVVKWNTRTHPPAIIKAVRALEEVEQWSNAYPLSVFPEPDFKDAAKVLKENGMTIDAISASNFRFLLTKIMKMLEPHLADPYIQAMLKEDV